MAIDPGPFRTVIAAAEHGSFRRAAASLGVRQSTLSRRIRQLEEELGVRLFERSSGGVRVTAAGGDVVRAAQRLLELTDRVVSIARSAGRGEAGDISIGVCTSLSASKVRAVLTSYLQVSPHVALFTDRRYPADAITLSETLEASWSEAELLDLMNIYPPVAINVIRIISKRLQKVQERVREIATQSAERRVAHAVLLT